MLLAIPLIAIPLVIYNLMAYGGGTDWLNPAFSFQMVSGATFALSRGDLLVVLALVFLFLEILKATRTGAGSILDHLFSTAVFVAALVQFLLVDFAATSTFFLLTAIALIDVIAGYSITIRAARRDVSLDYPGNGPF